MLKIVVLVSCFVCFASPKLFNVKVNSKIPISSQINGIRINQTFDDDQEVPPPPNDLENVHYALGKRVSGKLETTIWKLLLFIYDNIFCEMKRSHWINKTGDRIIFSGYTSKQKFLEVNETSKGWREWFRMRDKWTWTYNRAGIVLRRLNIFNSNMFYSLIF